MKNESTISMAAKTISFSIMVLICLAASNYMGLIDYTRSEAKYVVVIAIVGFVLSAFKCSFFMYAGLFKKNMRYFSVGIIGLLFNIFSILYLYLILIH